MSVLDQLATSGSTRGTVVASTIGVHAVVVLRSRMAGTRPLAGLRGRELPA